MRKNLPAGAALVMSAGLAAWGNSSRPAAAETAPAAVQETTAAPAKDTSITSE